MEKEPHLRERSFIYRSSGLVILCCMTAMGGYLFLLSADWNESSNKDNFLFWMEWIAVWSFADVWSAKGRAIVADIAIEVMVCASQLVLRKDS